MTTKTGKLLGTPSYLGNIRLLSGSCERMENLCGIAKTIFPQWPEAIWVEWGVHVPQIIPGQTDMGPAKRRDVFGDFGFKLARDYTERLDLRAASLDTPVGNLSGGNQQKVVIAKWLATQPSVIILDEPTKGVDIGSKAAVHEFMAELAAQGLAVIMVSSEIPEVLGMADRVIVMREGRIATELAGDDLTPETLVRHAAGI